MKTTTDCHCQHDIPRDGSGQRQRYLSALDPAYAPVDGRSLEDLLVFARRYAAKIRFWPLPDKPGQQAHEAGKEAAAETWEEFFRHDWAVVAASVGVTDLAQIKTDYDDTRADLETTPTRNNYHALFDPILGMARRLDRWYSVAIPGNPLHNDLALLINSVLRAQMGQIMAYDETFGHINANKRLNLNYADFANPDVWGLGDEVPPVPSIYEGEELSDQLRNAALFVDDVFQAFYNALRRLIADSDKYMQFALEQYPAHQPYMALFIAFLELFRLAQDQLNTLTERHLTYYYREVLRLTEQPAQPDKVHLVFELAQEVADYILPAGTPLTAGRDQAGNDLIYRLSHDFVVNQAQVNQLKTIRLAKKDGVIQHVYARPVAKSADGLGLPFADAFGKWDAFGKGDPDLAALKNPCDIARFDTSPRRDQAAIGFAIASPQLLLQGGNRKIELTAGGLSGLFDKSKTLDIWFTGEKEWVRVAHQLTNEVVIAAIEKSLQETNIFAIPANLLTDEAVQKSGFYFVKKGDDTIHIYLPISASPVIAYDAKKHGGLSDTVVQPVIKILVNEIGRTEEEFLAPSKNITIRTKVGSVQEKLTDMDGLRTLVLQNDAGLIDADNAFDPFTAYPSDAPSFYIGSSEVFNKPLNDLPVKVAIQEETGDGRLSLVPIVDGNERVNFRFLAYRSWLTAEPFAKQSRRTPILPVVGLTRDTQKGFIRFQLNRMNFFGVNNNALAANGFINQQQFAHQARLKSIALCYDSTLDGLTIGIDQFLHIYPFGMADVTDKLGEAPLLPQFVYPNAARLLAQALPTIGQPQQPGGGQNGGALKLAVAAGKQALKPQEYLPVLLTQGIKAAYGLNQYTFAQAVGQPGLNGGAIQEEGFLCIGLANLQPLQTLSLLFQMAEGTAEDEDYTEDPPEIHWSYVVGGEMRPLPAEHVIADGTYGLQTTGIIKFDIPADLISTNTLLPTGFSWLCASVTDHADRVPKLIDIRTQAIEAVFDDQHHNPAHYQTPLPAKSIGKLVTKPAEIKQVDQPFASFDGKPQETGRFFYTRVSERLRHKARAINAWDYEHLVLAEFPHIYKVKCITHTDPNCLCVSTLPPVADCCGPQVAPGHVLVVPVADFKNRNAVNPLQPKTSYRVLRLMEAFLAKRTSPFVTVHARNPRYEEVIMTFKVRFYAGVDKGYHLKKLNDDLVRYLTPWAFEENAEVSFAQKIYASAVINFIEERPYVDFITDFNMGVCQEQCCPPAIGVKPAVIVPDTLTGDGLKGIGNCDDLEQLLEGDNPWQVTIAPSTSRSLLVSVAQHLILLYEEEKVLTPCEKLGKI